MISFRRRTIQLSAWCLLSFANTLSANQDASASVTFCAYNVRNWLVMDRFTDGRLVTSQPKPESEKNRVIQILLDIKPDIVGLSEIGSATDLKEIQDRLNAVGIHLPHSELTHGGDEHRLLGLLSRFPINATNSQTDLTYSQEGKTIPLQRGLLDVTLGLPAGQSLRCLGVHLKSKREIPEADQALMRRNEAHLVRRHVDSILAEDAATPILLYGDFNEHRNEPAIKAIHGSRTSLTFMEDIPLTDAHGEIWTHFWDAADSYSRFDYCFVSRGLKPWVEPSRSYLYQSNDFDKASDHRPTVLVLTPKSPAQAQP